MGLLQIVVLAIVQGITEFLPISSSGHLILVPAVTGWPDQSMALDVASHVGSLAAVLIYFRKDVWMMLKGLSGLARGKKSPGSRLVGLLIVGTIPAIAVGLAFSAFDVSEHLRSIKVIAWTTLIFAVVMYIADKMFLTVRRMDQMTVLNAFLIGCAQAVALIPGTSRSGITMSAARMFGFERGEAARFSFLLSIPAVSAAGLLEAYELWQTATPDLLANAALLAGLTMIVALFAIAFLMAWLRRATLTAFVVYSLILAALLFTWIYAYGGGPIGF